MNQDQLWRAQVEKELRGADYEQALVRWTLDRIEQKPVYDRAVEPERLGLPGQAPFRRGSQPPSGVARPWQLCCLADATAPEQAQAELLEDLRGGADAIWLRADRATRLAGAGKPGEGSGVDLGGREALARVLREVQTELLSVHLDTGVCAGAILEEWLALTAARGVQAESRLHLGFDPLSSLARDGVLPTSLDAARALGWRMLRQVQELPGIRVFIADGLTAHAAGASEAMELAIIIASFTELLRAADRDGISLEEVAARTDLRVGVGAEVFLELAKLRALRELWARVGESCELDPLPAPFVHAVTSPRTLSQRDPWTNLLRGTTQAFAAAVGGVDALTVLPMDGALQRPGKLARRMARNLSHVLAEEAHLGAISDPAGGSFAIERLTDDLIEAAWTNFQAIEARGGLASVLMDGSLGDDLADQRELRHRVLATRKQAVLGVSEYPDLDGRRPEAGPESTADADSWQHGEHIPARWVNLLAELPSGEAATVEAWPSMRDAAPFEELRDRADAIAAESGRAPRVCLATLGKPADHAARANFVRNAMAAAGLLTVDLEHAKPGEGAGALAVIVCGTDAAYEEHGPEVVAALKGENAPKILLAGKPTVLTEGTQADFQQAGLDGAVHLGCDLLNLLRDLMPQSETASAGGQA